MHASATRGRGFSLIELLVAISILALSLGVLYRAVGGGVRSVAEVSRQSRALVIAQSVLNQRNSVPPSGWQESGAWRDFRWSVASAVHDGTAGSPLPVHRVQVDVAWNDGESERRVLLVTLLPVAARTP